MVALLNNCWIFWKRILLLCALEAAVEMFLLWLLPSYLIYRLVVYLLIQPGMVLLIFPFEQKRTFFRYLLVLYLTFFLIGGVQESIVLQTGNGNTLPIIFVGICMAVTAVVYVQRRKTLRFCCRVELIFRGRTVHLDGFLDSGNHLCDPLDGQPVQILEKGIWEQLDSGQTDASGILSSKQIGYTTVSGQGQQMELVIADEMKICQNHRIRKIRQPRIALAPGMLMQHPRAQMLLHSFYIES